METNNISHLYVVYIKQVGNYSYFTLQEIENGSFKVWESPMAMHRRKSNIRRMLLTALGWTVMSIKAIVIIVVLVRATRNTTIWSLSMVQKIGYYWVYNNMLLLSIASGWTMLCIRAIMSTVGHNVLGSLPNIFCTISTLKCTQMKVIKKSKYILLPNASWETSCIVMLEDMFHLCSFQDFYQRIGVMLLTPRGISKLRSALTAPASQETLQLTSSLEESGFKLALLPCGCVFVTILFSVIDFGVWIWSDSDITFIWLRFCKKSEGRKNVEREKREIQPMLTTVWVLAVCNMRANVHLVVFVVATGDTTMLTTLYPRKKIFLLGYLWSANGCTDSFPKSIFFTLCNVFCNLWYIDAVLGDLSGSLSWYPEHLWNQFPFGEFISICIVLFS